MTFVATWQNDNEFSFALAAPKVHIYSFQLVLAGSIELRTMVPPVLPDYRFIA